MKRPRIRTRMTGLCAHATPNGKAYKNTDFSLALIAYSKGTATEEQVRLLAEVLKYLKDKNLDIAPRSTRRVSKTRRVSQTMVIFGKEFTLTDADMKEYQKYQERLERLAGNASLDSDLDPLR